MNSRHCWIEIELNNLRSNFAALRREIDPSVKILAVVKANGYGHGLREAAKAFAGAGADYLGVSTLEEGLLLRKEGLSLPVLIFLPLLSQEIEPALKTGLTLTAASPDDVEAIRQVAEKTGVKAKIHLKVETGLGRLGFSIEEFRKFLERRPGSSALEVEGIYSHLEPFEETQDVLEQRSRFEEVLKLCEEASFKIPIRHLGASHGVSFKEMHYDMVRLGTILYGQTPHPELQKKLKAAFTFKTRVVSLRPVKKGDSVGYGKEYVMSKDGMIATIPVGYYEGFGVEPVSLNAGGRGLARVFKRFVYQKLGLPYLTFGQLRGKNVPVVGRVSMNMSQLDVSRVEGAQRGDEVVIPIRWVNANPAIERIYKG